MLLFVVLNLIKLPFVESAGYCGPTTGGGPTKCFYETDYCFMRYEGGTYSGCLSVAQQVVTFAPTCGEGKGQIKNGTCWASIEKRHQNSNYQTPHNFPKGATGWMCCCNGKDLCDQNYDPERPWVEHYCKLCAAQHQWDSVKQIYTDKPVMTPECSVLPDKRYCYDLSLHKTSKHPEHNERACEWKLMIPSQTVHYPDVKKSQCKRIVEVEKRICDKFTAVKDKVSREGVLCCCDAQSEGDGCNKLLSAHNVSLFD